MAVLLALRSRKHAKFTSENRPKAMEGVRESLRLHISHINLNPLSSARIFFGRGAVMAKALGMTPEEEYQNGLHHLAQVRIRAMRFHPYLTFHQQQIKGQVGLLFTNSPPSEVTEWFDDFHPPDFARSGNVASETYVLPAGPIIQQHSIPPEPFPHNEEPQLRKLGLTTKMVRGVPSLDNPHTVCTKGKVLTPEQAQLLKLIGVKMVKFSVGLRAYWHSETGQIVQVEGQKVDEEEKGVGDENEDDGEMSE